MSTSRDIDNQEVVSLISEWVSSNVRLLLEQVRKSYFRGDILVSPRWVTNGENEFDLMSEVFSNRYVRKFPCLHNVKLSMQQILKRQLERLATNTNRTQTILINVRKTTYKLTCHVPLRHYRRNMETTGRPSSAHPNLIGNPILATFVDVDFRLADAVEYWKLINLASGYDLDENSFDRALRRANRRWKLQTTTRMDMVEVVVRVVADNGVSIVNPFGSVNHSSRSDINPSDVFCARVGDMIPDLVPLASISKSIQRVVQVRDFADDQRNGHIPYVAMNDKVQSFWNSKFLFHLRRKYTGVALDTTSGKFYNADFEFREGRFDCRLSAITTARWALYVEGEDGGICWAKFRKLVREMWMQQRVNEHIRHVPVLRDITR